MSPQQIGEITNTLPQFTGTENYYQHWLKKFVYTDGVQYLAGKCGAYWLLDAIASWQPKALQDARLQEIQFWKLMVKPDRAAVLTCEYDTNDPAFQQDIPFTDFPLDGIQLYLANGVLMLPSEY